jgi:Asp-tRNA(Asn)/Glu-tRNA(Gln) amidotransferase C subunit
MALPEKKRLTAETAKQMAEVAGLDLTEDRVAQLAPQIQSLREAIDAMSEIDLTDVEPSTVFVPRAE